MDVGVGEWNEKGLGSALRRLSGMNFLSVFIDFKGLIYYIGTFRM